MGFTREDLIPTNFRLWQPPTVEPDTCRENSHNSPTHGRTGSLNEFARGGDSGRFGSVHFGT